jgi:hypothetical protein
MHPKFQVVVPEPDDQIIPTEHNQIDIIPVNHVPELLPGDFLHSSRKTRILGMVETRPVEDTSVAKNDDASTREHTEPHIAKYTMDDWHDKTSLHADDQGIPIVLNTLAKTSFL